ncbi:MAG: endolytic transglycosylase MltG [Ruminococcaceae bacterium]|nr:endolytic transglycosylase MltG [Oscillospiraceae bacterium]
MVSKKIIRTLSVIVIIFLLISMAAAGFYFGFNYVLSQNARFERLSEVFGGAQNGTGIDKDTPGAVEIVIPRAADTKRIAELLEDKGLIKNIFMFTVLSKFNGFDGSYMAGTHFVLRDMGYDEIMYVLCQNPQAVRVTFPEGLSYREIKTRMREAGVRFDEAVIDSLVRNPQLFLDYVFISGIEMRDGRDWLLQGYLFPDTYEFDINTDEETIIRTFLNNTERKLVDEYYERAEHIGMSMDEVLTMASLIQIECEKVEEMRTVSGVFYNRLEADMAFGADPTINYLRKEAGMDVKLWLSTEEIYELDSPYNTYLYKGLPPGPICSPGEFAIRAALWPETHPYKYFVARGDGYHAFAERLDQHERNIAKYRELAEAGETEPTQDDREE